MIKLFKKDENMKAHRCPFCGEFPVTSEIIGSKDGKVSCKTRGCPASVSWCVLDIWNNQYCLKIVRQAIKSCSPE